MSDIERFLDEAVRRSAARAEEASRDAAATAIRRARTRRRVRVVGMAAMAAVLAAGIAVPLASLSRLNPGKVPVAGPTPTASPSAMDVAPPPGQPEFHPATYREGELTVMPVTFPDGSTAELVYPRELELESGWVYPDLYIVGGPRSCGPNTITSRSNLATAVYHPVRPIAVFESVDGEPVALWRTKEWAEPYTWLVVPVESWVIAVNCHPATRLESLHAGGHLPPIRPEEVALWARSIDGYQTPDGFLVLTPKEPLRLGPWTHNAGPTLRFSFEGKEFRVIDIGLEGCDPNGDADRSGNGGVAQWCVPPGIRVYANGPEDFLDALATGLEIRNFRRG